MREHNKNIESYFAIEFPRAVDRKFSAKSDLVAMPASLRFSDPDIDPAPDAYETLAWKQMHAKLCQQVLRLPEREKLIIKYHYQQGAS